MCGWSQKKCEKASDRESEWNVGGGIIIITTMIIIIVAVVVVLLSIVWMRVCVCVNKKKRQKEAKESKSRYAHDKVSAKDSW